MSRYSESVSTGVWCVPRFGAGFEIALEPSKLRKEGENPEKGHYFYFLRQTLVCTEPWFKRDLSYSCRATCVAFLALRFRNVARESRYNLKVSQKRRCRSRLGGGSHLNLKRNCFDHKFCVAVQGVSQLECRKSRYTAPLRLLHAAIALMFADRLSNGFEPEIQGSYP